MQLVAAALEQRFVGGVLDQGVFEDVAGFRRRAAAKDQLRVEQLIEGIAQRRIVDAADGRQQFVREVPADDRCGLSDFLDRREAVEPGHERIVKSRGDRQRRQRPAQCQAPGPLLEDAHFEHGLGQLLDEQRHAVGLGQDLVQHVVRQHAVAG